MQKLPNNWRATESFTVTGTSSKSEAIDAVVAQYPTHPDNPAMKINPPIADVAGFNVWRVTAEYTFINIEIYDSALEYPTVYRAEIETMMVPTDKDLDGNPIVNSAGDPVDPPAVIAENVLVIYCRRAVPAFSLAMGMEYTWSVNASAFVLPGAGTIGADQGLCRGLMPVSEWKYGDPYVIIEGAFAFRRGEIPWRYFMKDQGRNAWYSDSGNKIGSIAKENGDLPGIDVALDGTGKPIITNWKVLKDPVAKTVAAAIDNPNPPPGLYVDTSRSTADSIILAWNTVYATDWSALPF